MDKVKILAIAPYEGLASIITKATQAREDITLTVRVGDLEAAIHTVENISWDQYDVLLSRGGTAKMLKHHIDLPIVEIPVSVYDVLRALKTAELYAKKVAVVGYDSITECSSHLKNMLQYSIDLYTINETSNLKQLFNQLKKKDYDLLLCDMVSYQYARKLGLNALLITSGEESILIALEECIRITRAYRTTKAQRDLLLHYLTEDCHEAFIYSYTGDLEFTTMAQSKQNLLVFNTLQNKIDSYRSVPFVFDEITLDDRSLLIRGQHVQISGQTHIVLYLNFEVRAPIIGVQENLLLDDNPIEKKSLNDTLFQMLRTIYSRELIETMDSYANSAYPILISGQSGCGMEAVVHYIYESTIENKKGIVTFDCHQIKEKKWDYLFNNSNSALLHSGITLYFKNVDQARPSQIMKLIDFMEQSSFSKYNRIIFSSTMDQGESAEEICDYIKNHTSCCFLALPPLNASRDRIPAILSVYMNNLTMETGKQIIGFTPEAMEALQKFNWTDNYSQLLRIVRSLAIVTNKAYIDVQNVQSSLNMEKSNHLSSSALSNHPLDINQTLDKINFDIIQCVLNEENGNQSKTAERLGISRTTLWRLLK